MAHAASGLVTAAALTLALLGAASRAHADTTIQDDRGLEVSFARTPARIVSLLPSLTEAVCALDSCDRLVGVDRFSNSPPRVATLPKLGGLEDTQVERLVALRADVVLAAPSARVIARLEALGQKVVVLDSRTHRDVQRALQRLGVLLDQPARADALWQSIEAQLRGAAARVPASMRGRRVYFEIASAPYAAGTVSFIGETLTRLGLANIVTPEMGPFPKLNPEFVVRAQPDIVMAARRNLDEMAARPGWAQMTALRQQQQCGFEAANYEVLVRPGPRLGEAALALADCVAGLAMRAP